METSQNTLVKPPQPNAPPLVMALLRTETMAAHKQLEHTKHFARLFSPDYSLSEYRGLLCRFYGFVAAIEPVIFAGIAEAYQPALAHRTKSEFLVRDLNAFGINELTTLPHCSSLPQFATMATKMGALYVMEGSTLGGQVISKQLKAHFGSAIDDKLNYYQCYGDNTGREWRAFQMLMGELFADNSHDIPEVVAAANATFMALYQWFAAA